ncbi:MAG: hypothetical protein COU31_03190 [Candidatus Magasanikbacteria bacterium CG10_big_fil_rev_8_21_14_0_10_40_10]|uniref:Uncharacterized protein n=1 Tax=Candidatus Magasanikbacteria bacterium CG10_big_fil_rev_8_21_14_0_10_40_10 TaxID=1974648 RepID=A0A2M6W3T7_9BACT|nr:MAG: hypothetical protein COU31_03190 [Candidatus Magasanikbacteria bacterium CG10_big_fil_rev_8_21_14_0_10_40_10]
MADLKQNKKKIALSTSQEIDAAVALSRQKKQVMVAGDRVFAPLSHALVWVVVSIVVVVGGMWLYWSPSSMHTDDEIADLVALHLAGSDTDSADTIGLSDSITDKLNQNPGQSEDNSDLIADMVREQLVR